MNLLERLHVLTAAANPGQPRAYSLTNPFAASLRLALTGGGDHKSFGVPCGTSRADVVTISQLDEFARKQWEGVLGYMVGSTGIDLADAGVKLSQAVKQLLQFGGLVVEAKKSKVDITQDGFAFILQEVNAQAWTLLILYLEYLQTDERVRQLERLLPITQGQANLHKLGMDPVDVLSFLFMLGSLELGQAYSKANLSPTQTQMLADLGDFGIIHSPSPKSTYFYPTRLATTLTSDAGALRNASVGFDSALHSTSGPYNGENPNRSGFIVVETNYRLYAYTSSPLQIAILQLFARLSTRYPNMVSGKITRESIRRAIGMGITSEQIISFLSTHAHPQMRLKNDPVLPATVVDQIRLWQIEGERMKATTGFLFKEFVSAAEFEAPCQYAEEIGVLVWKNEARRMFFVTRHEQIASFLKSRPRKGV